MARRSSKANTACPCFAFKDLVILTPGDDRGPMLRFEQCFQTATNALLNSGNLRFSMMPQTPFNTRVSTNHRRSYALFVEWILFNGNFLPLCLAQREPFDVSHALFPAQLPFASSPQATRLNARVARAQETAGFLCQQRWGSCRFPVGFGRPELPEERQVHDLDARTGGRGGGVWALTDNAVVDGRDKQIKPTWQVIYSGFRKKSLGPRTCPHPWENKSLSRAHVTFTECLCLLVSKNDIPPTNRNTQTSEFNVQLPCWSEGGNLFLHVPPNFPQPRNIGPKGLV